MEPRSNVTYFVLLGLIQNPKEQKVLSVMFLLVYILTVVGNLLIVVTITISTLTLWGMLFSLCGYLRPDTPSSSTFSAQLSFALSFRDSVS